MLRKSHLIPQIILIILIVLSFVSIIDKKEQGKTMNSLGIKDLQRNPANLTKALDAHEYTLITKHSKPIGLALSFNDEMLTKGLKTALLLEAYRSSVISLGQLSSELSISKNRALKMLSLMNIDVIDYDFNDDMKTIKDFL